MRILLITPMLSPAHDGAGREPAELLARAGHDVTVLAARLLPVVAWRGPSVYVEESGRLRVVRIDLPAAPGALLGLEQRASAFLVERALASHGVSIPDVVQAPISAAVLAQELGIRWGRPHVLTENRSERQRGTLVGWQRRAALQAVKDATALLAGDGPIAESMVREYARTDVQVLELAEDSALVRQLTDLYERAREIGRGSRMIFHAPYPIDPHPTSASRLRPLKMREAFRELGFQVHEITGNPRDRARGFRDARRRRRAGQDLAFLYSENSTQPNLFSTSIRTGLAPLLEARIFVWSRRSRIPAGEFYRDIYWKFSTRLSTVRSLRGLAMLLAYRVDLAVLQATGVHLFLPSEAMGAEIPLPPERISALPPGTVVRESAAPGGLHLFYVGGLGDDYGLHACVEAVAATPEATLTMCVPTQSWERFGDAYEAYLSDRIRVVHARSDELAPYYQRASACVLFVEPTPYRRFAAPVKFFEYLGYGKPILLSAGTLAGQLGTQMGIGLEIPYTPEAFAQGLQELIADPDRLRALTARAQVVRHDHTWVARAREAVSVLHPPLGARPSSVR